MEQRSTKHHLVFYGKEWSLRPEGLWLREQGGLIADLPRPEHDEIHRRVALVPLLGVYALQRVANRYEPTPSLYRNIDNFCLEVERANKHPKAHRLERQLGLLTIEAMQDQKDILKEFRKRS